MDKPHCVELGKPMNWCARALRAQHVDGCIQLSGEWQGWTIRGGKLNDPGGMTFSARILTALWRAGRLADRMRRRA
jgi:hypothetical protein